MRLRIPRYAIANLMGDLLQSGYERQQALLTKVQGAIVEIAATKDLLETKMNEGRVKLTQLEDQARYALKNGNENLARQTLRRRQMVVRELRTLEGQVQQVEREAQRLSLIEQRLGTQIETFHTRQAVIAARYSTAEAQVRINEAVHGVSQELSELGSELEQAEQKTERMQARADAIDHLVEEGILEVPTAPTGDSVERELAQFDVAREVEEQLAALKRQLE